ncbi:MAG: hypothetical protein ACLGG5_03235 [Thermoleophilia bacterium]
MPAARLSFERVDRRRLGMVLFSAAVLASFAYALWLGRGQTLILDEWKFLLDSRSWSVALLEPDNGHLILLPYVVSKLVYDTFGLSSHLPSQLVTVSLNAVIAALLYVFARKSIGPLFALLPGVLILFYGTSWDAIVIGYQLPNLLTMAAGLFALLFIRREDLRGDALACVALFLSLASFSVGVAFVVGVAVALLLRGRAAAISRAWVVLLPVFFYAAWFIWSIHLRQSEGSIYNVGALLSGMFDQLAAVLAGITGLAAAPGARDLTTVVERPDWGSALVILALVGAALWLRDKRPTPSLIVAFSVLVAYLVAIALGLNVEGHRVPNATRYVYMGTVLTLLVLIELFRGMKPTRGWAAVLGIAFMLSLLANGAIMGMGGRLVRLESATNRAQLGALEIARNRVSNDFVVESAEDTTLSNPDMLFDAGAYFDVTHSLGSPAYSEGQLGGAPDQAREAADMLLARALPISVRPGFEPARGAPITVVEGEGHRRGNGCVLVVPRAGSSRVVVDVPSGGLSYSVASTERPELKLRRFAEGFAVVPKLPLGPARVVIPEDRSNRPWQAEAVTTSRLDLCP